MQATTYAYTIGINHDSKKENKKNTGSGIIEAYTQPTLRKNEADVLPKATPSDTLNPWPSKKFGLQTAVDSRTEPTNEDDFRPKSN